MIVLDSDFRITIPEHNVSQLRLILNSLWMVEETEENKTVLSTFEITKKAVSEPVEPVVLMDTETYQYLVYGGENPWNLDFIILMGLNYSLLYLIKL